MTYQVGTHIDLRPADHQDPQPSTTPTLYQVGTQLFFKFAGDRPKLVRRIPVVFA